MTLFAFPLATDGDIAIHNHESVLERCWHVIQLQPDRSGSLGHLIDEENKRIQFLGDLQALDRLELLAGELIIGRPHSPEAFLAAAQVSSALHLFTQARQFLMCAQTLGGDPDQIDRIALTIDQATWENLTEVLDKRQLLARASQDIGDYVPLGSLLADLGLFEDAHQTYLKALSSYKDLSPFPLAWTCFQLGMLWGELMPEPNLQAASVWYLQAIKYLPQYVHARVHLSEIYLEWGEPGQALNLLDPIMGIQDPEIYWRRGQVYLALDQVEQSKISFSQADALYLSLLEKHKAAFADHAVEYFSSDGARPDLAFELASFNFQNRPCLRAFNLLNHAACRVDNNVFQAQELSDALRSKWMGFPNFAAYAIDETQLIKETK